VIRYPHIFQAVHFQPWLISPAAHGSIVEVLHSRLFSDQPQPSSALVVALETPAQVFAAGETRIEGSSKYAPATIDNDGIATVYVDGILSKAANAFEKSCFGGVGPQDVQQSLEVAMAEDRVRGIVLAINSPGGTVAGIPETADQVAAIQRSSKKPIFAFTDQQMASAAYWLAGGASRIYASRLATVGSIGVYMPWMDQSARAAMMGVRVQLIKDGQHKGAGYPGTSLTREQEALLQDQVNKIGQDFRGFVSSFRTRIQRDDMEGQSFLGVDAALKGFVDGVLPTIQDVKARFPKRG
jgi:signal peptide peptidase SppA